MVRGSKLKYNAGGLLSLNTVGALKKQQNTQRFFWRMFSYRLRHKLARGTMLRKIQASFWAEGLWRRNIMQNGWQVCLWSYIIFSTLSVFALHWYLHYLSPPSDRSKRLKEYATSAQVTQRRRLSIIAAARRWPSARALTNHRAIKWGETRVTSQVSCVCLHCSQKHCCSISHHGDAHTHTHTLAGCWVSRLGTHKHTLHTLLSFKASALPVVSGKWHLKVRFIIYFSSLCEHPSFTWVLEINSNSNFFFFFVYSKQTCRSLYARKKKSVITSTV